MLLFEVGYFSVYEGLLVLTGHTVCVIGWFVKVKAMKESSRDMVLNKCLWLVCV